MVYDKQRGVKMYIGPAQTLEVYRRVQSVLKCRNARMGILPAELGKAIQFVMKIQAAVLTGYFSFRNHPLEPLPFECPFVDFTKALYYIPRYIYHIHTYTQLLVLCTILQEPVNSQPRLLTATSSSVSVAKDETRPRSIPRP